MKRRSQFSHFFFLLAALPLLTVFAEPSLADGHANVKPPNTVESTDDVAAELTDDVAARVRCRRAADEGRVVPDCEAYAFKLGPASAAPDLGGAGRANGLAFVGNSNLQSELGDALYKDYVRTLDHNYELFRWQLVSTKVSFAMTVLLVLCGIVFSAMQFWKSHRAVEAGAPMPTELELSGGRIKVSSPVLGVVILVISLGFFYLFMLHAYPIEEVRRSAPATTASE